MIILIIRQIYKTRIKQKKLMYNNIFNKLIVSLIKSKFIKRKFKKLEKKTLIIKLIIKINFLNIQIF
jgi:hypothetical protein